MSKKVKSLEECLASDYEKAMADGDEVAMREIEHMMDKANGYQPEEDNTEDAEFFEDDFEDDWD